MRTPRAILLGVFFLSSAMLLLEILLTRIFSVMMFYHFAFLMISTALFGMSAASIQIYLHPNWFTKARVGWMLPLFAAGFGVMTVISFLLQRVIPYYPGFDLRGIAHLASMYVIVAIPFFIGGGVIALVLTHYASRVSVIYFADLAGASLGCALVCPLLMRIAAENVIPLIGILGLLSALAFSFVGTGRRLRASIVGLLAVMTAFVVWSAARPIPLFPVGPVAEKGKMPFEYRWSPMGRVLAYDHGSRPQRFPGKPDSVVYPDQKWLRIDDSAQTYVAAFEGDYSKVEWLLSDISAIPLFLRPGAKILDIGSGGGQMALAACSQGTRDYTGVEINPSIVDLVKNDLNEYSGGIYRRPEVRVFVGDGRSYAARSHEQYDLIAFVSATTYTATTAGAFMMAENNLFTSEAFRTYFRLLKDDGILSICQGMTEDYPGLVARAAVLCRATLESEGIPDAAKYILVVCQRGGKYGTVLLKKTPFTDAELDRVESLCGPMGWKILQSPRESNLAITRDVVAGPDLAGAIRGSAMNLSVPTDDRPFFFNLVPFRHAWAFRVGQYEVKYGKTPAQVLIVLLGISLLLTLLFILGPQFRYASSSHGGGRFILPTLLYFAAIGLGYILIEIPFTQQFVLFLGHPIYALSVVLFSLLLSSGLGSLTTRGTSPENAPRAIAWTLPLLVALLAAMIIGLPKVFGLAQGLPHAEKVLLSIGVLIPLGLLMGRPFALCLKSVDAHTPREVPWCWGVNGAASVLGTVVAMVVSISSGFHVTLWIGALCYGAAFGFFGLRQVQLPSRPSIGYN